MAFFCLCSRMQELQALRVACKQRSAARTLSQPAWLSCSYRKREADGSRTHIICSYHQGHEDAIRGRDRGYFNSNGMEIEIQTRWIRTDSLPGVSRV
jgi:hypothetical protein